MPIPGVRLDTYAAMERGGSTRSRRPTPRRRHRRRRRAAQQHQPDRGRRGGLDAGLAERKIPLDAYSQHVTRPRRPDGDDAWCRAGAPSGASSSELDAFRPGLDLYITEAGYTTAATRVPRDKVTEERAGRLPRPDLLAAAAPQRAGQGGRVVQPPGQRELARRPHAGGPVAQAELRAIPRAWSSSRAARSSADEGSTPPGADAEAQDLWSQSIGSTLQLVHQALQDRAHARDVLGHHLAPPPAGRGPTERPTAPSSTSSSTRTTPSTAWRRGAARSSAELASWASDRRSSGRSTRAGEGRDDALQDGLAQILGRTARRPAGAGVTRPPDGCRRREAHAHLGDAALAREVHLVGDRASSTACPGRVRPTATARAARCPCPVVAHRRDQLLGLGPRETS